jgi:predicted nucleic acid-binding protein
MTHLVIMDNEAVQALASPAHRKHRQALAYAQVVASRKRRSADIQTLVPNTVRVEAGWDRTSPAWAFPNRLRITDSPLDSATASTAAAIRAQTRVSVADAHIGAVIGAAQVTRITVVTSDPADIRHIAGDKVVTIAAI